MLYTQILKKKGFTLLEVTIVVAVISILATVFIVNYRGTEKKMELQRIAHELAQNIRGAKEMTMAGEEFHGYFPQGGYGLHFLADSNEYILFADCDGNDEYEGVLSICDDCAIEANPGTCQSNVFTEEIAVFSTGNNIKVNAFFPISPSLDIIFFPPDPEITIKFFDGSTTTIAYIAMQSLFGDEKEININTAGLIDIE